MGQFLNDFSTHLLELDRIDIDRIEIDIDRFRDPFRVQSIIQSRILLPHTVAMSSFSTYLVAILLYTKYDWLTPNNRLSNLELIILNLDIVSAIPKPKISNFNPDLKPKISNFEGNEIVALERSWKGPRKVH